MNKFVATLNTVEVEKFINDFSQLSVFAKSSILNEPSEDKPGFRKITITINGTPEECKLAIEGSSELAELSSRGVDFLKAQGWFSMAQEVA